MDNLKRFKEFYSVTLNPLTICQIIMEVNTLMMDSAKNKEYRAISSYLELKDILKNGF